MSFFSLVTELETLLGQLNTILAGADDETVQVNGVTKDSISKAIKDKFTELLTGQRSGVIAFKTYAELDAYTPTTEQRTASFKVANDSDSTKNGYYHWISGTTYEKDAELVANIISKLNTSDPVSGKAVHDEVLTSLKSVFLTGGTLKSGKALSYGSIEGKYIRSDGTEASVSSFSCTTFIPVMPSKSYLIETSIQDSAGIAYYDQLGNFISFVDADLLAENNNVLTTPSNGYFLRASFLTANKMSLFANEDITYRNTLLELLKRDAEAEKSLFSKELIFGGAVKSGNKLTVSTTSGAYIDSNGEVKSFSSSTSYTMFIPVVPAKSYRIEAVIQDNMRLAYYNKDFELISVLSGDDLAASNNLLLTPDHCAYVRSSFHTPYGFSFYANESISYPSLLLDIQRDAKRNIEFIDYVPQVGKLLTSTGNVSNNNDFDYTSLEVKAGDILYIEGYVTGNARLHNANGELFPGNDSTEPTLCSDWVLIESDGNLEISYIRSKGLILYKQRSYTALKKELNRIESLTKSVQEDVDRIFVPFDASPFAQDGYYLRSNGDKGSSAPFTYISLPVEAGDAFHISGYVQDLARLHDANGVVYPESEVVGGVRSDDTVYIKETGVLHISYLKSKPFEIRKIAILEGIAETIDKKIQRHNFNVDVSFCKAFHRNVLCLGDSLTSGANYDVGGSIEECYPYYLNLISGWVTTNAGYSGYAPIQIWDKHINSYDAANYDACILWLGTNNGLTDTIYDDTSSGDYLTYANTETGRYCSIIEKLLADNPNIKLYFVTVFATEGSLSTTNNVISQLAEKYNGYLIDCNPDGIIFPAPEIHKYNGVHFDKIGNAIVANTFYNSMLNSINDNIQDFDVVLLGNRTSSVFDN
ncbi:SGNH/GDSL hydrolase family protein [Pseudoalteromonas sp. ACER1]|uniref:SGNH/GDSL hydrolase family protein n=1 Tax=unclassified Pseudoalteromonas TaxID=194690 RepID=UPI001F4638C2|nr:MULTISPECIES: SGNH/GDSL hydrolase family protein [unclassified Pseudoalteromonas]MCF2846537.1 SGNH/GDSL hydrolase family protein [Pseudoalteromonas sp. PAST1]MCO7210008.1 SGNH/GDSL hydrolase family protein [Pseudoalteromonas sp. ACER1]